MVIHTLPFWFLVFALFLPRVALFVDWFDGGLAHFHIGGLIPLLFWALLPRALVCYLIYLDQGFSTWFLIHLVVTLLVWGGSGGYQNHRRGNYRRRRRDDY